MKSVVQLTKAIPKNARVRNFLGPWCVETDKEGIILVTDISEEDVAEAIALRNTAYDSVLNQLSSWLNKIHDLDEPVMYWETVLFRFLNLYINEMLPRYLFVRAALKHNSDFMSATLDPVDYTVPDTDQAMRNRSDVSDKLNLQLFSQIVDCLCSDSVRMRGVEFSEDDERWSEKTGIFRFQRRIKRILTNSHTFRRRFRSRISHTFGECDIAMFPAHFSERALSQIERDASFSLRSVRISAPDAASSVDRILRETLSVESAATDFERCILSSLRTNLPKEYVEDFSARRRCVVEHINTYGTPKAIIGGFFIDLVDRLWIAEARKRDSSFVVVQHGAAYGESIKAAWQLSEMRISDEYVSWGWSSPGVQPLPAPRLMSTYIPREEDPSNVLLVLRMNYTYPKLDYSLQLTNEHVQSRFVVGLDAAVRKATIARVRLNKGAQEERQTSWLKRFPELTIDRGRVDISQQFHCSKLVVVDYLFSTTFVECLAANIPVVVFSEDQKSLIHPEARKCFQRLYDVGVVHYDADAAADTVNAIYADPGGWWNEQERQQAIAEFMYLHGRTDPDAIHMWRRYLESLLH